MTDAIPGQTGGQHLLAGLIDHQETYGAHVIRSFIEEIHSFSKVVDIGAGSGRDLGIAKSVCPSVKCIALEASHEYAKQLTHVADEIHILDIERSTFPFENNSIDLFFANQVLEHTKEIWWIFHEVTRSLKIGGHFFIGVPNIASLHNRLRLLFGVHPSQNKLYSAHVRPFSKGDTVRFTEVAFPGGYKLVRFRGSQFYPFPPMLARPLCSLFPEMSYSIFFMFRKEREYNDEFLTFPVTSTLETNFFLGKYTSDTRY
jgi:SAM-dependent methyltransferase